jgi:hypothetical protein
VRNGKRKRRAIKSGDESGCPKWLPNTMVPPSRRGLFSSSSTTIIRGPDLRLLTEEPAEPHLIYGADAHASRPNVPSLDGRIRQLFKVYTLSNDSYRQLPGDELTPLLAAIQKEDCLCLAVCKSACTGASNGVRRDVWLISLAVSVWPLQHSNSHGSLSRVRDPSLRVLPDDKNIGAIASHCNKANTGVEK